MSALSQALLGNGVDRAVPAHELAAAVQLAAEGHISDATAYAAAKIPAAAEAGFDTAKAHAAAQAQPIQQMLYYKRLEAAAILLQNGTIDETTFDTVVGL